MDEYIPTSWKASSLEFWAASSRLWATLGYSGMLSFWATLDAVGRRIDRPV